MAVNLSPVGGVAAQFFDNDGNVLSGGKIYTYAAGTSTPQATYTTSSGSIPHSNPIILDSAGRVPTGEIWLTDGISFKFVLNNTSNTLIATYDNIYGIVGVQTAVGTTIPAGIISIWYGSIGSVPTGWYLCDGSNGTPDLRDRFIIGAGSTYSVGSTGGSTTRTLTTSEMPSHTHAATVTDPGHNHSITATTFGGASGGAILVPFGSTTTGTSTTGITVSNAATGSGTAFNILNPYYALAYVMKS